MIIRLIPPPPHPTILYGLTFPNILSLHDLGPCATIPPAWSSQLHILTSVLQLEPPSSIHMLDRAVGLVARVHEITMDVPHKEFLLRFIDGRELCVPMNSDCVRMLLGVVVDVKGCSEPESQRNSLEGSACPGTAEDLPAKSSKPGKHKRQRSLLFSLISSLVPKSLSSSSPPPPSSAPPPTPLPPLPVSGRLPSFPSFQTTPVSENPDLLRKRARATLIDVWRRHVVPALAPQHTPAAGYAEWTLIAMASRVRAEMESVETSSAHARGISNAWISGSRHRKVQSEGRKALDFGDRSDDHESERRRCRPSSPFPGAFDTEDTDRVVYPRRGQADEWGVRYLHDVFNVEYNGYNDSLLGENFTVEDDWDDTERLTFELSRMGRHDVLGSHPPGFGDRHLYPADFGLDCDNDDGSGLADTAFDMSRCPPVPSDVNDDESDDSQISLRTPEDEEYLPLTPPVQVLLESAHDTNYSAPRPSLVSRVSSSRPRPRNVSAQYSSVPSTPQREPYYPAPRTPPSNAHHFDMQVNDFIASRLVYLEQICTALEIVRSRAREEGWRLVRATSIGAKIGWMDDDMEKSLEIKAKRRAWSSGIKISAPYTSRTAPRVWDGSFSTFRSPSRPPGLASSLARTIQGRGPIVPTGLSLGIPVRGSPLATHVWSANDGSKLTLNQSSLLNPAGHGMGTIENRRSPRVTFSENAVTKLFPVYEDEGEGPSEPVQVDAIGFPQAAPVAVPAEMTQTQLIEGPAGREDDPFYFCPSRPRTRTTSMYMISPAPSAPSSPVLPMFRPTAPPPLYQAADGIDASAPPSDEKLDASALLLHPLSSLAISPTPQSPSQPPFVSDFPFVPRPRAVSLPTPRSYSGTNKTRRTSFNSKEEYIEDLSQAYVSPPPDGPLVVSATPAPHEQYPRYAHVQSPIPASKKSMNTTFLGRTRKEVVFEQAGSEFTVGIEVALGRAEEGRVVW